MDDWGDDWDAFVAAKRRARRRWLMPVAGALLVWWIVFAYGVDTAIGLFTALILAAMAWSQFDRSGER